MALTGSFYTQAIYNAFLQKITTLATAQLKAVLLYGYTPNVNTHSSYNDIYLYEVSEQATHTGYTVGGLTLTNVVLSYASGVVKLDFDDPTWNPLTLTTGADHLVIMDNTPTGRVNKKLFGYIAFGQTLKPAAEEFTPVVNASGFFNITVP